MSYEGNLKSGEQNTPYSDKARRTLPVSRSGYAVQSRWLQKSLTAWLGCRRPAPTSPAEQTGRLSCPAQHAALPAGAQC